MGSGEFDFGSFGIYHGSEMVNKGSLSVSEVSDTVLSVQSWDSGRQSMSCDHENIRGEGEPFQNPLF